MRQIARISQPARYRKVRRGFYCLCIEPASLFFRRLMIARRVGSGVPRTNKEAPFRHPAFSVRHEWA